MANLYESEVMGSMLAFQPHACRPITIVGQGRCPLKHRAKIIAETIEKLGIHGTAELVKYTIGKRMIGPAQ